MLLEDVSCPLLVNESDSVLVDFASAGNRAAFDVLILRYRNLMRAFAVKTMRSTVDADDVVQEACITAWEKLSTISDGAHVKGWLMRVVYNKSIDRIRKNRPLPMEFADDLPAALSTSPFNLVEALLQNEALTLATEALPARQRRAWVMREFSGCSYAAIAQELDVPISTVRGLLARARRTLASELEAWR
ncbi:RNA polymerase sigma factor [Cryobacterium arcticum]|nr:RNA polymerase sigma factor [Cryobacterium arcticum]